MTKVEKVKSSGWIPNLLTPALLIVIIFNTVKITKYITEIESRTLSSVEMKVRLEDSMAAVSSNEKVKMVKRIDLTEKNIVMLKQADSIGEIDRKEMKESLSRIEKKLRIEKQ